MHLVVAVDIPPRLRDINLIPTKTFKTWEVRETGEPYMVKYWDIKWLGLHIHLNNEKDCVWGDDENI